MTVSAGNGHLLLTSRVDSITVCHFPPPATPQMAEDILWAAFYS
ncbi:MAG: hypothetical protein ACI8VC_000107 [Candidatus Endobugula sp.]|jgi:hypothetical protein